jgi:ubiquinone/menaquinone biosynthesis C-methylase UbiE
MPKLTSDSTRHFGKVFNHVAQEYDRNRPGYQEQLIDRACQIAQLENGDRVLEIGCGTGQLTQSLLARGLAVTAVEPGEQLLSLAAQKVVGPGTIEFINSRFEDAQLPTNYYKAVFCASAFHWIDPDVSWTKSANCLKPGGVIALIQYFGLIEKQTSSDLEAQLTAFAKVEPTLAVEWPHYYELDAIIDGVAKRQKNISEAWAWLGNYDVGRSEVSNLFHDLQIATIPILIEQTADQLIAILRTTSPYNRLTNEQQRDLELEYALLYARLGRPIRSSTVNVLMTARKTGR